MKRILATILIGVISLYIAFIYLLPISRPLIQPIVNWWYGNDFLQHVENAAHKFPEPNQRCIFDDSRNMYVMSFADLNVDKMIDNALDDRYPRFRLNRSQREPHFRIFANNQTYYWSFRERKFFAFRGERWTLKGGLGLKNCAYYRENPVSFAKVFEEREGMPVSEENFCCSLFVEPSTAQ